MYSVRQNKALATFSEGMNCAQSVASVFASELGMDPAQMKRISACFGGGMRMGATCGALTGALMVLGLARGYSSYDPLAKQDTERLTLSFLAAWKQRLGKTDCKDILGLDPSIPAQRELARERGLFDDNCPHCIAVAVELLEAFLSEPGSIMGESDV